MVQRNERLKSLFWTTFHSQNQRLQTTQHDFWIDVHSYEIIIKSSSSESWSLLFFSLGWRGHSQFWMLPYQNYPVVNFINVLRANFMYKSLFGSFFYLHVTREKLLKRRLYKKCGRKMLMKLTPDVNSIQHCWFVSLI